MTDWKSIVKQVDKFKYPLLVLLIGILLMLLPGSIRSPTQEAAEEGTDFAALLSHVDGVGESMLAMSGEGVVIVCEGAEDPAVRLSLLQAIRAYTGFSSDRITILKLAEHGRGG